VGVRDEQPFVDVKRGVIAYERLVYEPCVST